MDYFPHDFRRSISVRHDDAHQLVSVSIVCLLNNLNISILLHPIRPNSSLETMNANAASMWIKVVSSWLGIALYSWSLIAPIVLSDRDFN